MALSVQELREPLAQKREAEEVRRREEEEKIRVEEEKRDKKLEEEGGKKLQSLIAILKKEEKEKAEWIEREKGGETTSTSGSSK